MKNLFLLFLVFIGIIGCSKKSNLEKEFLCKTTTFSNTEEVSDFKNKFSVQLPKSWNTQLYYNSIQTQIMAADTIKNLTNTYTLILEYNSGDLIIDENFKTSEINKLSSKGLYLLKSKNDIFKDKPSIWFVSKGKKLNYDYYFFEMYIKQNKLNYFKVSTAFYGDKNIDDRLCESLHFIQTLKYIE